MKSVFTKRYVRQKWWGYRIASYIMIAAGVFVVLVIWLKRGPIQYTTYGLLMMLYGLVLTDHVALARGQNEIKKSISDLKEKIDELEKRSKE